MKRRGQRRWRWRALGTGKRKPFSASRYWKTLAWFLGGYPCSRDEVAPTHLWDTYTIDRYLAIDFIVLYYLWLSTLAGKTCYSVCLDTKIALKQMKLWSALTLASAKTFDDSDRQNHASVMICLPRNKYSETLMKIQPYAQSFWSSPFIPGR